MSFLTVLLFALAALWALIYFRVGLATTTALAVLGLGALTYFHALGLPGLIASWLILLALAIPLNTPAIRRRYFSDRVLAVFKRMMPSISDTEREALDAGTVWWEGELFDGRPRWSKLLGLPAPALSEEEQAFLDGPVKELCHILDDWEINERCRDLPPEVWQFIKDNGLFGMIIPKEYGGLGFSALAHSAVIMKLASRSITAAVTVMVPNSLGPAELLLHYGTDEQKRHYLPRLARGEEIPCFALTGPEAGSDAGAMPDTGVVCRGEFQGRQDVLGIRLNWEKRYITLGPVATVLGLAFKLRDPDGLLGDNPEPGITCALIPTDTPGVTIGERHDPLGVPFQNGPNSGKDVFIPVEWIIGGTDRAGQGWRMLMERLAVGRGISLPALSTGAGKLACRVVGAYARVRRQFKLPIGRFEGIEEALARIGGETYLMDAVRNLAACAVDAGEQAPVVSAIAKYNLTERMRRVVADGMDVLAGAGICLGPRNLLGRAYQAAPISITVEGANILTRSLIIFGQGAMRCHPYLHAEMHAASEPDPERAAAAFDKALFGHIGHTLSNAARALFLGLTGARLAVAPKGPAQAYYKQLTRMSAAFALSSDVALLVLGSTLKRREKLSGRLADALSNLFLASAVLKHFEDQDRHAADVPLVHWACEQCLYNIQQALDGVLRNLPNRYASWLLGAVIFPLGRRYAPPADALGHDIAALLTEPSTARNRLTGGIFVPTETTEPMALLDSAMIEAVAAEPIERLIRLAVEQGRLSETEPDALLHEAVVHKVIREQDAETIRHAGELRRRAIQVDAFQVPAGSSAQPRDAAVG
jgi:acyl-CoA dehydrogenase